MSFLYHKMVKKYNSLESGYITIKFSISHLSTMACFMYLSILCSIEGSITVHNARRAPARNTSCFPVRSLVKLLVTIMTSSERWASSRIAMYIMRLRAVSCDWNSFVDAKKAPVASDVLIMYPWFIMYISLLRIFRHVFGEIGLLLKVRTSCKTPALSSDWNWLNMASSSFVFELIPMFIANSY